MSHIEKRARELLAAEYVKEGRAVSAQETMQGHDLTAHAEYIALRAIIAALTPPEGYVLVPVEPTTEMLNSPYIDCGPRTAAITWAGMLATRPEVP
ncbi:hypothetical protein [Stenotrophomonas sp. BIO128-Bstrain]|uniref:hypothetical protein n=1 Tax=Stenotrophomonas sp. BIO128-Bstrain TaxID=3027225 RepID=UPI0024DE169F|nr:hypothetical protein [Stenotrophomonas sp. BIO128-Bstrain]WIA62287.1 hypothetical protein POS15_03415 [Stenotrophomonas sp. BIO128-Bstrain]